MLDLIRDAVTLGTTLGIILASLARFLPNDKLYAWGLKSGQFLNSFGSSKMGSVAWERLEDFVVNSLGEYLRGMKIGLDDESAQPPAKDSDGQSDVRI